MRSFINVSITNKAMITFLLVAFFCLIAGAVVAQVDSTTVDSTITVLDTTTSPKPDTLTHPGTATGGGGLDIPDSNPFTKIDIPNLLIWENFLYSVLLSVLTWFSYLFPKLKTKRIPVRTIVIGGTLIAVFVGLKLVIGEPLSFVAIGSYLLNFLVTTNAYDKIYKELFGPSPDPLKAA